MPDPFIKWNIIPNQENKKIASSDSSDANSSKWKQIISAISNSAIELICKTLISSSGNSEKCPFGIFEFGIWKVDFKK